MVLTKSCNLSIGGDGRTGEERMGEAVARVELLKELGGLAGEE